MECLLWEQILTESIIRDTVLRVVVDNGRKWLIRPSFEASTALDQWIPHDFFLSPDFKGAGKQALHTKKTISRMQETASRKGLPHWIFLPNKHKPVEWTDKLSATARNVAQGLHLPNKIVVKSPQDVPSKAKEFIEQRIRFFTRQTALPNNLDKGLLTQSIRNWVEKQEDEANKYPDAVEGQYTAGWSEPMSRADIRMYARYIDPNTRAPASHSNGLERQLIRPGCTIPIIPGYAYGRAYGNASCQGPVDPLEQRVFDFPDPANFNSESDSSDDDDQAGDDDGWDDRDGFWEDSDDDEADDGDDDVAGRLGPAASGGGGSAGPSYGSNVGFNWGGNMPQPEPYNETGDVAGPSNRPSRWTSNVPAYTPQYGSGAFAAPAFGMQTHSPASYGFTVPGSHFVQTSTAPEVDTRAREDASRIRRRNFGFDGGDDTPIPSPSSSKTRGGSFSTNTSCSSAFANMISGYEHTAFGPNDARSAAQATRQLEAPKKRKTSQQSQADTKQADKKACLTPPRTGIDQLLPTVNAASFARPPTSPRRASAQIESSSPLDLMNPSNRQTRAAQESRVASDNQHRQPHSYGLPSFGRSQEWLRRDTNVTLQLQSQRDPRVDASVLPVSSGRSSAPNSSATNQPAPTQPTTATLFNFNDSVDNSRNYVDPVTGIEMVPLDEPRDD